MVGNSLWFLVMQSDTVSKIVLLILLILSVICWTIFLFKIMASYAKQNNLNHALFYLSVRHSTHDLTEYADKNSTSIITYLIKKQESFAGALSVKRGMMSDDSMRTLVAQQGDQLIDALVQHEQSLLSILSTTAVVAPLLGLFGTVWGLVHAFLNIAQHHTADIATVAPGIAEALITTLVGLMVAIPAQVMYNILLSRLRHFESLVMRCSDIVTVVFQHRS